MCNEGERCVASLVSNNVSSENSGWGLSEIRFLVGGSSGRMMLDTGAGVTCVSNALVSKAGLTASVRQHKVGEEMNIVVANGERMQSMGHVDLDITVSLMLDVSDDSTPIWVNWVRLITLRNVLVLPFGSETPSDMYVAYADWNVKGVNGVVSPLGNLADLVMKGARISNSPRAPKANDGTSRVIVIGDTTGVASVQKVQGVVDIHPSDMSTEELRAAILLRVPLGTRDSTLASRLVDLLISKRKIFDKVDYSETNEVVEFTLKEGVVPKPVSFQVNMPRGVKLDAAVEGLTEWLNSDVCERVDWTSDAYGFVIVVPKQNGKWRITINPMELNRITERIDPEGGVMPKSMVREVLRAGHNCEFAALIDFSEAFTCLKLGDKARQLSTFSTPIGKLRWKQGFFGWHSFPAIFQRMMMEQIVLPTMDKVKKATLIAWIDDLFAGAPTENDFLRALAEVLVLGLAKGLRLNLAKCFFLQDKFDICGIEVDVVSRQWRVAPRRVESLRKIEVPKDRETLSHVLGVLRYYYFGVVNQLAQRDRLALLQELDVAGIVLKVAWTEVHTAAMRAAIEEIIGGEWLLAFDPRKKVYVWTDASGNHGYAVIASQYDDVTGELRPIAVYSNGWLGTQMLWPAQVKECYAQRQAVAVHMWESYPHADIVLMTDNKNLAHDAESVDLRVRRWRNDIWETGCLERQWISGDDNNIADYMSRVMTAKPRAALPEDSVMFQNMEENTVTARRVVAAATATSLAASFASLGERESLMCASVNALIEEQGGTVVPGHLEMAPLLSSIIDEQENAPREEQDKWLGKGYSKATLGGRSMALWKNRVVIPDGASEIKAVVLRMAHDAALHYTGASRTLWAIENQAKVHWVNISQDVEQYIRSCYGCAMAKGQHVEFGTGTLSPTVAPYVHHTWYVDVKGPLPFDTGSILVIVEALSRYVRLRYINTSSAKEVCEELREAICDFGTRPVVIRSDGGQPFNSDEYRKMCKEEGILPVIGVAYHSPGQGAVETKIRAIAAAIIATLGGKAQTAWFKGDTLMKLESVINSTVVEHLGMSPYRIMYGREPRTALSAKLDWSNGDFGSMVLGVKEVSLDDVNNIITTHHETVRGLQGMVLLETSVSQALTKRAWDARRKQGDIKVGAHVIVLTAAPNRLASWYTGPYEVTRVSTDGNRVYGYDFMDTRKVEKGPFHVMRVKTFDMSRTTVDTVGAFQVQEGWGFVVGVVGHRLLEDGSYEYNMQWAGVEYTTWSPAEMVKGMTKVVDYCAINGLPHPVGLAPRAAVDAVRRNPARNAGMGGQGGRIGRGGRVRSNLLRGRE